MCLPAHNHTDPEAPGYHTHHGDYNYHAPSMTPTERRWVVNGIIIIVAWVIGLVWLFQGAR